MSRSLTVFVNDQVAFESDRDKQLEDRQLEFLDRMDSDMDRGVRIQGVLYENPDPGQRARFVAMNLIRALQQDDAAKIAASCAYLMNRRPQLAEIRASDREDTVVVELIDDQ